MEQFSTRFLLLMAFALVFSSCVSLKQTDQTGIKKTNELSAFNGVYQNRGNVGDSLSYASLWRQVHLNNQLDSADFRKAKIQLTAIDRHTIKATWWQGDKVISDYLLKGKLKANYFVSKAKRTIIPIPLIYGEFKNNQFQLALNENNELLLHRLENQWGWVFVFFANNDRNKKYTYKRLNE